MPRNRTLPWAVKIANDLRAWMPENSYNTGKDLALDLDIKTRVWDEVMMGRPVGNIYVYLKIFLRTGLESCDPRKIPESTKRKKLSNEEWEAWLAKQVRSESIDETITRTEGRFSEMILELLWYIEKDDPSFRDALLERVGSKMFRLSTFLNTLLIDNPDMREKQIRLSRELGRTTRE